MKETSTKKVTKSSGLERTTACITSSAKNTTFLEKWQDKGRSVRLPKAANCGKINILDGTKGEDLFAETSGAIFGLLSVCLQKKRISFLPLGKGGAISGFVLLKCL